MKLYKVLREIAAALFIVLMIILFTEVQDKLGTVWLVILASCFSSLIICLKEL